MIDCTRPDIAFAVGVLDMFRNKSDNEHWHVVTRVMRYLIGKKNCGLFYTNILLYLKAFVMQIGTLYQVIPVPPLVMS